MNSLGEYHYFSEAMLVEIERLCQSDSELVEKDRSLLTNLMEFLQDKGYLSKAQKYHVHRILRSTLGEEAARALE